MKKVFLCLMVWICVCVCPVVASAEAVSTDYGDIQLTNIELTDEEIIFTTNVNAYDKKSHYFVNVEGYKYKDKSFDWFFQTSFGEQDIFSYGKNKTIVRSDIIESFEWSLDEGKHVYCFRAYLHDADNYDWDEGEYAACFGWSDYIFKNVTLKNGHITMTDYNCSEQGHQYSKWKTTKEPTVFKTGVKTKTCHSCHKQQKQTIKKLTPTIKLSATTKNLKQLHTFKLKVSNLAKGDSIESVKVSSKKIISTERTKNTITVKGKKTGSATVTVKLKSGKTAKCKVTVIKDKFTYDIKNMSYSTRTNTFSIRLKNTAKHTVTIYAKDAKLIDWDYKSYDRKVKSVNGESYVKIKPGKTLNVKFKLKGTSTWPGYERKTMKFQIKFDGNKKWIKMSENNW